MDIVTVIEKLSALAGRKGMVLLGALLYGDAVVWRTGNGSASDLLQVDRLSPRLVVLGLVAIALFPVAAHFASWSLQLALLLLRTCLEYIEVLWPAGAAPAQVFRKAFQLKGADEARRANAAWKARSVRLMRRALAGSGPALEVYNERARRCREESDRAKHALAVIVLFSASALGGPQSLAATASSDVRAVLGSYGALGLAILVVWGLLVVGLREAPAEGLGRDVADALSRIEDRAPATRAA